MALLVPEPRRATRVGLVGTLTAHYGSPGQLADYRESIWRYGSSSTTSHHTGSINLDSVSTETHIWDIVDRCRESHADSDARRFSKPGPERALPIYTVDDPGRETDDRMVADVTTSPMAPDQVETLLTLVVPTPPPKPVSSALEQLLQRLLVGAQAPKPVPPVKTEITDMKTLLQHLLPEVPASASRARRVPCDGTGLR